MVGVYTLLMKFFIKFQCTKIISVCVILKESRHYGLVVSKKKREERPHNKQTNKTVYKVLQVSPKDSHHHKTRGNEVFGGGSLVLWGQMSFGMK